MLNNDVLKEFLFDCQMRKLSERTLKSYRNNNLALFRFIENEYQVKELEEVSHLHIRQYVKLLTEKELKESYINGLIKCYRAYFDYCVREGYITRNPIDKIKSQKMPITLINTFTLKEVTDMIKYYRVTSFLELRNRLILVILFDSGIRNAELCDLTLDDIRNNYININGKGKKIRHVPVTPIIYKTLVKYLRLRESYVKDKTGYDLKYLFLSQKGKKLTPETIERVIKEAGEAVGVREEIRCSPHTARHFYAQTQLKNGCDIYTLSRLLGHSRLDVTKIYLQSIQSEEAVLIGAKTSPLGGIAI